MYFNNRATAYENEDTLARAIARAKTFEEHQVATAIFLTVLVNNQNTTTQGWTQNQLRGFHAPNTRQSSSVLREVLSAVQRTLDGYGPQAACGEALVPVDEALRDKDTRFRQCPAGTVALFRGVLDNSRWDLKAGKCTNLAPIGYFVSTREFVVLDPVLAGSYLQGVTRWHGGMDTVGHLLQSRESLKLLNRPLDETHALAETYHEHPDKGGTVWLQKGMRFDLLPEQSSLSRILTAPEDTAPMTRITACTGFKKKMAHLLGPTELALRTAWAMTDIPATLRYDGDYKSGLKGASKVIQSVLEHDPALCMDRAGLALMLAQHGCTLLHNGGTIKGPDDVEYSFGDIVCQNNYSLGNIGSSPFEYGHGHLNYAVVLGVAAIIDKYDLPPEALLGLLRTVLSSTSAKPFDCFMLKLPRLFAVNCDPVRSAGRLRSTALEGLVSERFLSHALARTRATYHDGLNTKQRKKLLAKFYPAV